MIGSDYISYFYIFLIFVIGIFLARKTSKKIKNNIIYFVFLEHMLFSFLYYLYTLNNFSDASMYYTKAMELDGFLSNFATDTRFVILFTSIFVKYLLFSKLAAFFLFGLFGFIGFQYLIKMFDYNKITFINIPIVFLILLLPGFHFWTSAIGKDSLFFMLSTMSIYGLQNIKKRFLLFLIPFILLAIIRPYMGFVFLLAIIIALFLKNPLKYKTSFFYIGIITIIVIIIFLPFITSFLSIDQFGLDNINERVAYYNDYGANKTDNLSSYVDVGSYNLPMKMFAYLFRPLFFDAHSILQLLASFENTFLLIIIFKWLTSIKYKVFTWYRLLKETDKILVIYILLGWLILAESMYNLGLASRQKYMLLPIIFILIFRNFHYKNNNNLM